MERIRGLFVLFGIISIVSVASARSVASSEAAGGLMSVAGFFEARNENHRRLRAAAPVRRVLLDVMPWDTVTDQPGSVATTDVIKDPRDPACYDCGRLGGGSKKGGSSRGKLVEPESAAEDEEAEGGEEAAVVVVVDDRGGQPSPFVAPSASAAAAPAAAAAATSPGPAPAPSPAPAISSSSRQRGPLDEGGETEPSRLPSSSP